MQIGPDRASNSEVEKRTEAIRSYRDLRVWKEAMQLMAKCYRLTDHDPPAEEFGLKTQMRRAAVSIPSNIAEGHARMYINEYRHFVSVALGSLAELETQVEASRTVGLLDPEQAASLTSHCERVGKMLQGLKTALRNHGSS